MRFFENISVLNEVLSNNETGILTIKVNPNISPYVRVFKGDIISCPNKESFLQNLSQIDVAEVFFEKQDIKITEIFPDKQTLIDNVDKYTIIPYLWDYSEKTVAFSNMFCEIFLKNQVIVQAPRGDLYKIMRTNIDVLLTHLYFSKTKRRTVHDILDFYNYKDSLYIKTLIYQLFIIGQLVIHKDIESESIPVDKPKNVLLQKLFDKIANLPK